MIRKTLGVGIIFLFIVSAVSPMVIGYNSIDSVEDEYLEKLAIDVYNEFGSSNFEYLEERLIDDSSYDEIDVNPHIEDNPPGFSGRWSRRPRRPEYSCSRPICPPRK